jgi:hypothetical protein
MFLTYVQWELKNFNTLKPLQVGVESVLEEKIVEMFQLC